MMKSMVVTLAGMASGGRLARRTLKEGMLSDDMYAKSKSHSPSYDRPELACVDCPEFVKLSAKGKEDLLWQHIISDDYSKVKPEDRPWVSTYEGKEKYKCYGKHIVKEGDTNWKPANGQQTCPNGGFCTCSDDFPMGVAWVPTVSRVMKEGTRAFNGTMPMFFDRFSDVNPADNVKLIHSYGATARVKVVMTAEGKEASKKVGYTGMYANGFEHGLFRLSIVTDFSKSVECGMDCDGTNSFKPSVGLKMLRDGEISSNLVAQVNLGIGVGHKEDKENGLPSWKNSLDFFDFVQATWLPPPNFAIAGVGAVVVNNFFSYAEEADEISGVGIRELASAGGMHDNNTVKGPRLVYFVPTDEVKNKFSSGDHDARHDMMTIPAGTAIYNIVALAEGDHCLKNPRTPYYWEHLPAGCKGAHLETVVTKSAFVASDWGDRRLFFQHERLITKNGKWTRKMCQTKDGSDLPDTSEYRMASDLSKTCTQECGDDMHEIWTDGPCPYGYMEGRDAALVFTIVTVGDERLLGRWVQRGTHDGKPMYTLKGKSHIEMKYVKGDEDWVIRVDEWTSWDEPLYRASVDSQDYPLTGWEVVGKGIAPAPVFDVTRAPFHTDVVFYIATADDKRLLGDWVQDGTYNSRPRYILKGKDWIEMSYYKDGKRWIIKADEWWSVDYPLYMASVDSQDYPLEGWRPVGEGLKVVPVIVAVRPPLQ